MDWKQKLAPGSSRIPRLFAIDLFGSELEKNMRLPNATLRWIRCTSARCAWIIPNFRRIFNIETKRERMKRVNWIFQRVWIYLFALQDALTNHVRSKHHFFFSLTFRRCFQPSGWLRKRTHLRKFGKIARGRWESTIDREPCKTPYLRHPGGQGSRDAVRPF